MEISNHKNGPGKNGEQVMEFDVVRRIREVIAEVPVDARLKEYDCFRDDDLGPATIGVILSFDNGHLSQIEVPADHGDDPDMIGVSIASAVITHLAIRDAVAKRAHLRM
jgi:hypothetical protein